ncbi:Protein fam49b, partial [Bonamia ostreae]
SIFEEECDEEVLDKINSWTYPENVKESQISVLIHFFQSPTPFITKCSKKIGSSLTENEESSKNDDILQHIPNIFLAVLEAKLVDKDLLGEFASAMVCSLLIVDRLLPEGIFHKDSHVDINGVIDVLTISSPLVFGTKETPNLKKLIQQLCYWSMHLRDDRTPAKIRGRLSVE